jgi:cyclopropane fatty-acyl-phospholipid synthase-like methyltransferase
MSVDPKTYDSDYYRSSNYADYLERADRYKKTAYELTDLLRKLNLVQKDSTLVDYGCAVGFLLEGFQEAGYSNVLGYEISDWAVSEGRRRGNRIHYWGYFDADPFATNVLTALDVFEHMTDEQVMDVVQTLNPSAMVVRIPSSTDGGKTFALEVSRADPTHINCKTKEQWIEFFRGLGYRTFLRLNLYTVYDTPGVTCLLIL